MSQPIGRSADNPAREPTPQPYTDSPPSILEHSPLVFQPFPARNRVVPAGNGSFASQTGLWDAEVGLGSDCSDTADVRDHLQTRGSLISRTTQRDEGSILIQERQLSALPAFTPFPAAAPSSRYAPPPDSRAEPARPMLPPIHYSEDSGSGPWTSERPTNLVGESSTPAIRYPR
ncbi:unnamed protein product [Rhizoctonia solani]|uniref:Uncharacterized protein n=1 Tax=Rhizoctonia solani TaxID=456999 RepID=A0A8H2X2I0_9AGAM|nr:unnamed protein product [Rhizoctonia solani]